MMKITRRRSKKPPAAMQMMRTVPKPSSGAVVKGQLLVVQHMALLGARETDEFPKWKRV